VLNIKALGFDVETSPHRRQTDGYEGRRPRVQQRAMRDDEACNGPLMVSLMDRRGNYERMKGLKIRTGLRRWSSRRLSIGPGARASRSPVTVDVMFQLFDNELLITNNAIHHVANRNYADQLSMFEHREMAHGPCSHYGHAFLH
jgi:hypothetical protein